ncbi:TolC family outer membrane protein [bacterium]|nr:TolC family outer membrane protein [bacterium]
MKRLSLLSFVFLPVLVSAVSIGEVVQKTIESHPQIQIKKEELYTQRELLKSVKAGYLPSVDVSYSVGPEITKTILNKREQADLIRQETSAVLSQNIFAGFSTENGVKQQKALVLSANDAMKESVNNLALEAVTAYLDVLRNKELLEISKENVDVHKKYLSQIKAKLEAGVGRSSDYQQTLSRFENAKSVEYLSQQNFENAIFNFQRIFSENVSVEDFQIPVIGELPANSLDSLIELAIKNNPTVHVSQNDIQAAQAALNRSNAAYYPSADLKLKAYWNKNVNGISTDSDNPHVSDYDEESGYNALLVFNYNIFSGFSDSANKQVNQHKLLKQNNTLADAKRYITASTQIAFKTFELTQKQLVHIDKNIQASARTVSDYQKENELGRRSIIDLLNIELEYNAAKNRKVTAEYDRLLSYYQILSHTGKILEEMNVIVE